MKQKNLKKVFILKRRRMYTAGSTAIICPICKKSKQLFILSRLQFLLRHAYSFTPPVGAQSHFKNERIF